jgi:hypothetical protein
MLRAALDHHLWESCKALLFRSSRRSRLLHLAWYGWHWKGRQALSAFLEISTTRTFVANGSGAGVEFFPPRKSLVHSPWRTSAFLELFLKMTLRV